MPRVKQDQAELEKRRKQIFQESIMECENLMDRQSYIGAILSNYGLGPNQSEQAAQQVDQMFTEHKRKINEFT